MISKLRTKKAITILSVSLGLVISVLFSNVQKVDAATNMYFESNGISGSINSNLNGDLVFSSSLTYLEVTITINFEHVCNGQSVISIYNVLGNNYDILLQNAYVSTKTSTSIAIHWNNVSYIELHLYASWDDMFTWIKNNTTITAASAAYQWFVNNWETRFNYDHASFGSMSLGSDLDDVDTSLGHIESDIERNNELLLQLINGGININGASTISVNSGTSWPVYTTEFILMLNKMQCTWSDSTQEQITVATGIDHSTTESIINQFYVYPYNTLHIICYANIVPFDFRNHGSNDTANGLTYNIIANLEGCVLVDYQIVNNTDSAVMYWWYLHNSGAYVFPIYWGYNVPDDVRTLINQDSSVISKMNEILQAIHEINLTAENDTEINNYITYKDTTITNIQNDHTTVNNITNDFSLDFTDANDDITLDTDIIDGLVDTSTFWKQKLGETVTALDDFQYPVVLGFILLALLALIGA